MYDRALCNVTSRWGHQAFSRSTKCSFSLSNWGRCHVVSYNLPCTCKSLISSGVIVASRSIARTSGATFSLAN